jgi:hypothetical protein
MTKIKKGNGMNPKILGLLAVGLLVAPLATRSAPINYDESASGDISPDIASGSLTLFTLGVGVNTVAGRHGSEYDGGDSVTGDSDPFNFVIPVGARLTTLSISWANTTLSGAVSNGGITTCILSDSASNVLASVGEPSNRCANVVLNSSGSRVLFADVVPLDPGAYRWSYGRGYAGGAGSWYSDYRLDFTVESIGVSVHEPGTLALLGLGLTGLGLSRRRKAN